MNIRTMIVEDYPSVDRLMQHLHKIHVEGRPDLYVNMEHPYSKEKVTEMVESEKFISIVAAENDIVVGLCFVEIRERSMMVNMRTAYMDDLIVDGSCQKKGIAKALFAEAEARAKELGAKRLDLMVWEFNKNAISFYERLGMTPQRYIFEKEL